MKESFPIDQQPIDAVFWAQGQCFQKVGLNGVTLIEVQYVPGNGAMIPWFICWGTKHTETSDTPLVAAINSSQVESVLYREEP